ncbi:hypothetical protein DSCO28_64370 [Desulfosarcina ovata subsp. sediminis]|uniref:Polysaccharide pyruvyl transferase domain-containing protein n=1 Tax=Desulfosarcina ovata subsp. sediminis TaxID=885957 RepID=A0A5K8A0F0_9BACT|nr:polysaccharide pyruvyl transferase family protein [Desulfosarcina ovata]BBO85871.1 hypothetical protein DSCO28_64370 [Desulfosarcina ovata subsp. sediminis]
MINVFIAEEIPCYNKGEAALMHGIMETIRIHVKDEVNFCLCSRDRERDQNEYGQDVKVIQSDGMIARYLPKGTKQIKFAWNLLIHFLFLISYRLFGKAALQVFRGELWNAYANSDIIVLGHDNAFTKYHFPLIVFSKWLGKKVCVYGSTIMPAVFGDSFSKQFGIWAMKRADLITTREERTFKMLKDFNLNGVPIFCTADKAFILNPVSSLDTDVLRKQLGIHGIKKPEIGVMVTKMSTVYRAAFKGHALSEEEKYEKHSKEIAKALDLVLETTKGSIVFLGHCTGPDWDRDDRIVARSVLEKMAHKDRVCFVDRDLRAPELKGLMGSFDFVVSERTHGGIGAASMTTPTLWITHPGDHRTHGIVGNTLGLSQCLYNTEDLNHKSLSAKIKLLYQEREGIVHILDRNIPTAKAMAMKNGFYFNRYLINK